MAYGHDVSSAGSRLSHINGLSFETVFSRDVPVLQGFTFVDGGRTFTCSVEVRAPRPEAWWWFGVSTEAHNRYAPFLAQKDDSQESVQQRIVAYYEDMLFKRSQPSVRQFGRGRPSGAVKQAQAAVAQPEA
jgi:hypothetical protein